MTDNEIIKALECCIADKCMECPLRKIPKVKGCMNRLSFALDLINRQKAEIERLQEYNREYRFCNLLENALIYTKTLEDYNNLRKAFKAHAVKEFAKKFEKEIKDVQFTLGQTWEISCALEKVLKEMAGEF